MSTTVEYILEVETGGAEKGLKKTDEAVKKTSKNMTGMKKNARAVSGSMNAVGQAASLLSPELAGLGAIALSGGRTISSFGRALAAGNPIIIGATVAITGLIAVYAAFSASTKRNQESQKALSDAIQTTNQKMEASQAVFNKANEQMLVNAEKVNELSFKYQELTGQITATEAAEMRRNQAVGRLESGLTEELGKQRRALFEQKTAQLSLQRISQKRIADLKNEGRFFNNNMTLTKEGANARSHLEQIEKRILNITVQQNQLRKEGTERIKAQTDQADKALKGIAEAQKKQKQREKWIEASKNRQSKLSSLLNSLASTAVSLSDRLLQNQISRMEPMERANAEYQKEIINLDRIEQNIIRQFAESEKTARSKKDNVLLTEIQAQKEKALAQVQALRGDAEIARRKKILKLINKSLTTEMKGFQSLGKKVNESIKKREKILTNIADITADANEDQLSDLDKINLKEKERLATLQQIADTNKDLDTSGAVQAVKDRAERDRAIAGATPTSKEKAVTIIGMADSVVKALSNPADMLMMIGSAFGPIGLAVGALAGGLSELGQKDPEEIREQFRATFQGIAQGLKVVFPVLLEMLIPELFKAALMVVDALIQLVPNLIASLLKIFVGLIDGIKNFFSGKGFFQAIGDALSDMFERLIKLITSPFEGIFGGSKMGGGRMLSGQGGLRFTGQNRGLAMLHEGEMVVPRTGQMSSSVARDANIANGGSGGINIVINSAITERSAVDSLVRKIEERFGSFGQSTSPLFGGK
jgi:hypothetical protein